MLTKLFHEAISILLSQLCCSAASNILDHRIQKQEYTGKHTGDRLARSQTNGSPLVPCDLPQKKSAQNSRAHARIFTVFMQQSRLSSKTGFENMTLVDALEIVRQAKCECLKQHFSRLVERAPRERI